MVSVDDAFMSLVFNGQMAVHLVEHARGGERSRSRDGGGRRRSVRASGTGAAIAPRSARARRVERRALRRGRGPRASAIKFGFSVSTFCYIYTVVALSALLSGDSPRQRFCRILALWRLRLIVDRRPATFFVARVPFAPSNRSSSRLFVKATPVIHHSLRRRSQSPLASTRFPSPRSASTSRNTSFLHQLHQRLARARPRSIRGVLRQLAVFAILGIDLPGRASRPRIGRAIFTRRSRRAPLTRSSRSTHCADIASAREPGRQSSRRRFARATHGVCAVCNGASTRSSTCVGDRADQPHDLLVQTRERALARRARRRRFTRVDGRRTTRRRFRGRARRGLAMMVTNRRLVDDATDASPACSRRLARGVERRIRSTSRGPRRDDWRDPAPRRWPSSSSRIARARARSSRARRAVERMKRMTLDGSMTSTANDYAMNPRSRRAELSRCRPTESFARRSDARGFLLVS